MRGLLAAFAFAVLMAASAWVVIMLADPSQLHEWQLAVLVFDSSLGTSVVAAAWHSYVRGRQGKIR